MTPGAQDAGATPSLTIQDALPMKNVKEKGEGPTYTYRATLQTELCPSSRGEINKGNQLVGVQEHAFLLLSVHSDARKSLGTTC